MRSRDTFSLLLLKSGLEKLNRYHQQIILVYIWLNLANR